MGRRTDRTTARIIEWPVPVLRWLRHRLLMYLLTSIRHDLHLKKLQHRWLATLDEIVADARKPGHRMLPVALSAQSAYRWQYEDYAGAAEAAEEAVRLLEPLAAGKPGRFGTDLLLARFVLMAAHTRLGRADEAVPALENYVRMLSLAPVEREPNLSEGHRRLLDAYRRLDRPAEAVPHAEALVRTMRAAAVSTGPDRFDLAEVLCVASDCRRLAGLPALDSAVEAVAVVCDRLSVGTNGGTPAMVRALDVLDDALGNEHSPELIEVRQWLATRPRKPDIKQWLKDAPRDHESLAMLLELAMRSLVACGRPTAARRAGREAIRLYQFLSGRNPRCRAAVVRVRRDLEQIP